jgi:hypothetical protein
MRLLEEFYRIRLSLRQGPAPTTDFRALVRVFAARTVRWRGIFAVRTSIVVKEHGASRYSRYDYTAWGEPIRVDGFASDARSG